MHVIWEWISAPANISHLWMRTIMCIKESGSYTGALDLNYREFARIYEFVNNVGDRHNHNCYLVMVTMNTLPEQLADIEEIEKALDCMEQSIRSKIRKVDVCTRYSSMQYLIILFEPQENQIPKCHGENLYALL